MARKREYIPSAPFRQWLEARYEYWQRRLLCEEGRHRSNLINPATALATELGWEGDAGIRKLHRFRFEYKSSSRDGLKQYLPTDVYARDIVEEALHNAGVPFEDLYPDFADDLEPVMAWCESCGEDTLRDREGSCQWCAGQVEFRERQARMLRNRREWARKQAA